MDIRDLGALRQTATERLGQASYDPKKLVLLHTAVSLGVSFLIALLNLLLSRQIDGTGGLAGVQSRTILVTIQSGLQYGGSIALPFWEIGILSVAIRWARGQEAGPHALLNGFRRFGPVLRLMLLQGVLYFAIAMACIYVSTLVYMMTPLAKPLMELMMPMLEETSALDPQLTVDQATMEAILEHMGPVFAIFGVLFLLVSVPLLLRFRLSEYLVMDGTSGAMQAMLYSWKLTKGNVLALLKLDLSFWWFYGLQLLVAVISYGDVLLPMAGVSLPFSGDLAYFTFYLVHILLQLALFWWIGSRKYTTYALAYDGLLQPVPAPAPPAPPSVPWDY